MSEPRGITFEQLGLGSVLRRHQLKVPPNQREYAWEKDHVSQLLDDIAKAINDGVSYFLGTIVTIPRDDGTLEVVDGQQRLATTAILLAAIRDYLSTQGEEFLVESINNDFLTGIDRSRRERVPKLRLNVLDNELFGQLVNQEATPAPSEVASHENLMTAHKECSKRVRSIVGVADVSQHGDFLNTWVSFLEQRALVVLLQVADDADAFRMFETLNDRGLRTSQADLVKNYVFGRSGNRTSEVQARWLFMRGTLETLDDDEITLTFLRHAVIVLTGYVTAAQVYERVQTLARSETSTVSFMASLESLAGAYVATFNPEHERWGQYPTGARRALEVLSLFNIKPFRPLILAIAAKLKPKEAADAFSFLVALGVRLMIASSTRSGSVETPLADAAEKIYNGSIKTVRELRGDLKTLIPQDGRFRDAFSTARVSNAKLARYYLRALETQVKSDPEPYFIPENDPAVITLEHVLPRKPGDEWPTFSDEEVDIYARRIGNLVLMRHSDNSTAKSSGFQLKRDIYRSSPYELTRMVGEFEEWTPESVGNRQRELADLAVKTWPID